MDAPLAATDEGSLDVPVGAGAILNLRRPKGTKQRREPAWMLKRHAENGDRWKHGKSDK